MMVRTHFTANFMRLALSLPLLVGFAFAYDNSRYDNVSVNPLR